jgi:hypothetical protein
MGSAGPSGAGAAEHVLRAQSLLEEGLELMEFASATNIGNFY